MITGDNKLTAEAIAEDIGIFRAGEDISGKSMTGELWLTVASLAYVRAQQGHE